MWVTLDNEAVVNDVSKMLEQRMSKNIEENEDIWTKIAKELQQRGAERFKVTWTKGHETEENILAGRSSPEE